MPHRCLADLLEELGAAADLVRIEAEVDPILEAAEITNLAARGSGEGGPVLVFANVKGHAIPLLTNLLGSEARLCRALGVDSIAEAVGRVERLAAAPQAEGWLSAGVPAATARWATCAAPRQGGRLPAGRTARERR